MSVTFYMDENVQEAIIQGLRLRAIDLLTAAEDGHDHTDDSIVLDRAGQLRRVLFTQDTDFLAEGARRQLTGEWFVGVVYAHQLYVSIGQCIRDLELIAHASDPSDFENQVTHLPL